MCKMQNNMPQGYKQTELGIIPEDWEVVNLGNIAKVNGRIGFRGYTVADLVPKGFGAITLSPSNIINNQIDYLNCTYISWYKYHESPEIKVRNGDILLVKTGSTFGKSAFVKDLPEKATINPQFVLLNNFKCDSRYLSYVIAHDIIQNQIHADIVGGAIPTLSQEKIANFTLFAPIDIAEQMAIAEALSDVDGLIAALDKKIAKKRLLKQGAMQQLLTGKKRLPGFTDEWVEKKVKDVFRITRGYVLATNKVVERPDGYYKYPVFSSQTQNNGVMGYYSDYLFEDAITWTTDGANAGEVNYRQGKFYCTNVCGVLISEEGYANECIASIINMVAKSHVSYIGNPKLMNNVMADIEICIPPSIKEQQAIATILSDMDKEIADLEAQRDKYRLLKSGMMQKLLTGQIRLK